MASATPQSTSVYPNDDSSERRTLHAAKQPVKPLPAIYVGHENSQQMPARSQEGISKNARGTDRTRDWVKSVGQSKSSQRMEAGDGELLNGNESYAQPFWSVSTDVMDSLVEELNPDHGGIRSLPTTASIISANERRRYVMESDDEDEEVHIVEVGKDKSFKMEGSRRRRHGLDTASPAGYNKAQNLLAPTNPTLPSSPISPLELSPPESALRGKEASVVTMFSSIRSQSPSPSLSPAPKTPVQSIDDIVKKHRDAVGDAEKAASDRMRKEIGLFMKTADRTSCMVVKEEDVPPAVPPKSPTYDTVHAVSPPLSNSAPVGLPSTPLRPGTAPSTSRTPVSRPCKVRASTAHGVSSNKTVDASPIGDTTVQTARASPSMVDRPDRDSISISSVRSKPESVRKRNRQRLASRTPTPLSTPGRSRRISMPATPRMSEDYTEGETHEHAKYLRSPHLNRTVTIPASASDPGLTVSYSDVGHPKGHPVVLFLGLGCVRYLTALFGDIAQAFNLRLVCIDRWGLGKTTQVAQEKRDVHAWAQVVEIVLDQIKVDRFQVLAHSAGAPYALASVMRMGDRVRGKLHLLAPWVGADVEGGYKWLKWVPKGVIKSATAAEWKLQTYLLGKPPPLQYKPVGHNLHTFPVPRPGRTGTPTPSSEEEGLYEESKSCESTPVKAPALARKASKVFGPRSMDIFAHESGLKQGKIKNLTSLQDLRSHSENNVRVHKPFFPQVKSPPSPRSLQASSRPGMTDSDDPDSEEEIDFGLGEGFDAFSAHLCMPPPPSIIFRPSFTSIRTASTSSHTPSVEPERLPAPTGAGFTLVLTQASHAESEPGTTSDLLSIVLNKSDNKARIDYSQIHQPVKVWWGREDDRISEKSMRWLERCMKDVELVVVEKEGHGLLSSVTVMWEVFESLGEEVREWGRIE